MMKPSILYRLKRSARPIFSAAIPVMLLLCATGLGSALQGRNSATLLSIPYLWTYSLLLLPVLLHIVVRIVFRRLERFER